VALSGSVIYAVVGTDEISSRHLATMKFEDSLDLLRKCSLQNTTLLLRPIFCGATTEIEPRPAHLRFLDATWVDTHTHTHIHTRTQSKTLMN
jgi:hypothetical protein